MRVKAEISDNVAGVVGDLAAAALGKLQIAASETEAAVKEKLKDYNASMTAQTKAVKQATLGFKKTMAGWGTAVLIVAILAILLVVGIGIFLFVWDFVIEHGAALTVVVSVGIVGLAIFVGYQWGKSA